MLRLARVVIALAIVLGAALGTVGVAQACLPGSPLYPVKLQLENWQLALARDPATQARVALSLAQRRVEEVERLTARERAVPEEVAEQYWAQVEIALQATGTLSEPVRLRTEAQFANQLADQAGALERLQEGSGEDTPIRTMLRTAETARERLGNPEPASPGQGNGDETPDPPLPPPPGPGDDDDDGTLELPQPGGDNGGAPDPEQPGPGDGTPDPPQPGPGDGNGTPDPPQPGPGDGDGSPDPPQPGPSDGDGSPDPPQPGPSDGDGSPDPPQPGPGDGDGSPDPPQPGDGDGDGSPDPPQPGPGDGDGTLDLDQPGEGNGGTPPAGGNGGN